APSPAPPYVDGTPKRVRNNARRCSTSDQSRPPIRPPSTRGKQSIPRCPSGAPELVEQRLCVFEVGGVEAFGEPVEDRREEVAGFGGAARVAGPQGGAHGGAKFPALGRLLLGDVQGFAIQSLGGLGTPLPQ